MSREAVVGVLGLAGRSASLVSLDEGLARGFGRKRKVKTRPKLWQPNNQAKDARGLGSWLSTVGRSRALRR